MIDTALDLPLPVDAPTSAPGPMSLAAVSAHANLSGLDVDHPSDTGQAAGFDPASTVRLALTRTLTVALIAARHADRYDWTHPVEVDQLVTDAAWDLLAELGEKPPR